MFLKRFCLLLALVSLLCLLGCVDPYGPGPGYYGGVPTGYYPVYPTDVYPYYRGGYYYYPYWTGVTWNYHVHNRPDPRWTGRPVHRHGPPPKHWKGGHHQGGHVGPAHRRKIPRRIEPQIQHRGPQLQHRPQPQIRHRGQHSGPSFNSRPQPRPMMRVQPQHRPQPQMRHAPRGSYHKGSGTAPKRGGDHRKRHHR